jgi:hypothetical protein
MMVFPVWVSRGKISMLSMYFPLCLFCSFIENMFAVNNCTMLKSTFGIREIIGFREEPLWSGVWLGTVISLVTVRDL